ncbi:Transcriptional regulator OS=Streptomyces alboniger OX=132473 GN=CP975_14760 PE=4 SV=1 [Streptomyces alboniger]
MPPMLFDDGQAVALAVALQTASAGATVAEDAARALATLRQVMPPRPRHRSDLLRITVVQPPVDHDAPQVDPQVLVDLSRAIHAREELRFADLPARYAPAVKGCCQCLPIK